MATAGYSGKPLAAKLGIKAGFRLSTVGAPEAYRELLGPVPQSVRWLGRAAKHLDCIHLFVTSAAALERQLPRQLARLESSGMLWVSWPKKASGVETDVSEDVIRGHALRSGLVDVKVCAVDDVWSALKLVVRLENRAGWPG